LLFFNKIARTFCDAKQVFKRRKGAGKENRHEFRDVKSAFSFRIAARREAGVNSGQLSEKQNRKLRRTDLSFSVRNHRESALARPGPAPLASPS
jgi:hypothetical protein